MTEESIAVYMQLFYADMSSRGIDPVLKVGGGDGGPIYIHIYVCIIHIYIYVYIYYISYYNVIYI